MKKKNIAMAVALATVMAATPFIAACSGDHYNKLKFDAQDTGYAVTSQGGSAVAYGNYVYFINGTRGYEDTDGKNNVWNEVVKGGLYRAELLGEKNKTDGKLFDAAKDPGAALGFVYKDDVDYFDEEITVANVDKIAPKTIGTTGYSGGGIFIYDNYVYFASPNNQKDRKGNVQTTLTDFFMMPLNGGSPKKIYTTAEGVDTSSSAYAFYKYGDSVYLVVDEGGTIATVAVNAKGKVKDPVKYEVNATSVYFPVRDTYYNGISTDTIEDFIFFVRAATDDDETNTGNVIEGMRPDGSEGFKFIMNGGSETIEAVRDGVLFYRTTEGGGTKLAYNSLHNLLMSTDSEGEDVISPTYTQAQLEKAKKDEQNIQIDGKFSKTIDSSITAVYPFRPDTMGNEVFFLGVTSSEIRLYRKDGSSDQVYNNTGTVQFIKDGYAYIKNSSDYVRVALFPDMDGYGTAEKLVSGAGTATLECDLAAGYFTYYDTVDQWADNYTYFCKVDGLQNIENDVVVFETKFVGQRAEADIPTEEQIKAAKGEE